MGFSRQEYWMGCHALLQDIFPTQGFNPRLLFLLHWQADSYHWATQEDINQFNINHQDINQCELVLMLAMQLDFYYVNQQGTRAPVCCSWWSMLELQKCMLNKDKMWHSRKKKKLGIPWWSNSSTKAAIDSMQMDRRGSGPVNPTPAVSRLHLAPRPLWIILLRQPVSFEAQWYFPCHCFHPAMFFFSLKKSFQHP